MTREIKFRAYSEPDKKFDYSDDMGMESFCYYYDLSDAQQYTGLKDRNGVEIWDGDIVRINHPLDLTGDFINKLGIVFWWGEEGGWYHGHASVKDGSGRPPKRMWEYCEVIGNADHNPELLEPQS